MRGRTRSTYPLAILIVAITMQTCVRDALGDLVIHYDPSDTRTTFKNGRATNPDGTFPATQVGDTIGWIMDTRVPDDPMPDPDNGQDSFVDAQQAANAAKPVIATHPTAGNVMNFVGNATAGLLVRSDDRDLVDGVDLALDYNTLSALVAGRVEPTIASNRNFFDYLDKAPVSGGLDPEVNGFGLRYNFDTSSLDFMVKQSLVASVPHTPGSWFVANMVWDGANNTASLVVDTGNGPTNDNGTASNLALLFGEARIGNIGIVSQGFGLHGQIGEMMLYNDVNDHSDEFSRLVDRYTIASEGVPGDYNGDGTVDGADYVVWRKLDGQSGGGLAADGSGPGNNGAPDGQVNNDDYLFWQSKFGEGAAGSGGGAVPEPSAAALCAMAVSLAMMRIRPRHSGICRFRG